MKTYSSSPRSFFFALLLALTPALACAQSQVAVDADVPFDPVQALGIIVTNKTTTQRPDLAFERNAAGGITVRVPITEAEQKNGAFVSALLIGSDGEVAASAVRAASSPSAATSILALPACPGAKLPAGIETQRGLLQSLVEVRSQQRDVLEKRLEESLSGDFLAKLQRLEAGFGLVRTTQLAATLPAPELHDRLARLSDAIKNYRAQEQRRTEAEKAAPAAGTPSGRKQR